MCWVALLMLLPSCATEKNRRANDIVRYVNEGILEVAPLEAEALNGYASVTGENFKSQEDVLQALESKVIPLYESFYQGLRRVPIQEEEVGRLHGLYVQAASHMLEGFKMKRLALKTNDPRLMTAANTKIEQARAQGEQWRKRLEELCAQYGVKEDK